MATENGAPKVDERIVTLVKSDDLIRANMKEAVDDYGYDETPGDIDEDIITAHIEKNVAAFRTLIKFAIGELLGDKVHEIDKSLLVEKCISYCHWIIAEAIRYKIRHDDPRDARITMMEPMGGEEARLREDA